MTSQSSDKCKGLNNGNHNDLWPQLHCYINSARHSRGAIHMTHLKMAGLPEGGWAAILHSTCVVYQGDCGTITLNHGGFVTMSTRKAMNIALTELGARARVSISKGEMILERDSKLFEKAEKIKFPSHGKLQID